MSQPIKVDLIFFNCADIYLVVGLVRLPRSVGGHLTFTMEDNLYILVNGRQPPILAGNLTNTTTKNKLSQFKKIKSTLIGCDIIIN